MKFFLIFVVVSLPLASCASASNQYETVVEPTILLETQKSVIDKPVKNDKPVMCYEPTGYDNEPIPIDTGVFRDAPIDIISRALFIDRLKVSPLWEKIERKQEDQTGFKLNEMNKYLSISGDGPNPKQIHKIYYHSIDSYKRNEYGHQLLDQEKFAMTEIIDLVIDDHDKATEILDQLYQQYLVKVQNNDVLSDGETLHTYVRYDDKFFELWGLSRDTHSIEACNFNMLTTLTIS